VVDMGNDREVANFADIHEILWMYARKLNSVP